MKTSPGWSSATFQRAGASQRGYELAANKSSVDGAEIFVLHVACEKTGISAVKLSLKHGLSPSSKDKEGRISLRISVGKLANPWKFARRVYDHVGPSYDGTIVNVLLEVGSQAPISDVGRLNYSLWEADGEDDLLKGHTGTDTLKGQPQYNPFEEDTQRA